ncbi:MAG: hypothetical protein PHS19_01025 [Eubacteriales bacterium]|nr:hypothetical protein [Eubacteriales bacterium]
METLNSRYLNNAVKIIMLAAMAAMLIICFAVYKADMVNFAVFVGFILFYVQLPGLLIIRMLRIRFNRPATTLCIGLFTGWGFVVGQYFITELIGTNILLYALGPICSVLFIIAKILNRKCDPRFGIRFSELSTALFIFVGLALLYSLLNNQYLYLSPEVSQFTYMNPDKGYHLGLIGSLSHGWPIESPWVQGRTIHYHVFTELMYSVPLRLFGVPADVILLSCGPFMTVYTFALSLYTLFSEFTAKVNRAGLYCLALMLSNIFIAKAANQSLAFFFIFRNENATAFGVSCMFAFLVFFRYWYERFSAGENHWAGLFILTMLIMLLTGLKGPMGLVIIGAVWGTYLIGIIIKKVPLKTILPIIILTMGFLVIYIFILGSKGQSNGSGTSIFAFATIVDITFYKSTLVAFMKSIGLPKIIRLGILLVTFMIFTLTAFIIPFAAGYIRELILVFSGRKDYDFTRVIVYATCLLGFAGMFIMNYSGHSQVYFGYAAILLVPLVSFWFFEDLEENKSLIMNLVRIVFIAALVFTSIILGSRYMEMIDDARDFATDDISYSRYISLSHDEYEAMIWIRDNTPEDALLATDRYYSDPLDEYSYHNRWNNRFFLYADYSNRFCYLAGSGYNLPAADGWMIRKHMILENEKMYDSSNEERGAQARRLGVDYVVVSKDFTDAGNLSNEDYKLSFSNDGVDIYKVMP